jgi:hypothetical protein
MLIIVYKVTYDLTFYMLDCLVRGVSELFLNLLFLQMCYMTNCMEQ